MLRVQWTLTAAAVLALAGAAPAQEQPLAGNWKVTLLVQGQHPTLWLVHLEPGQDGAWTGKVLAHAERAPEASLKNLRVSPQGVRFTLAGEDQSFSFEGAEPAAQARTVLGSVVTGSRIFPARLERTRLKSLNDYDVDRETLATQAGGPEVIEAASSLLSLAGEKKASREDVANWAGRAFQGAEPFGRRYQMRIALRITELLAPSSEYAPVAVDYGRKAEHLLAADDPPSTHKLLLGSLAQALASAGQAEEAREVEARNAKIEWIKAQPYRGRKGHSDRAVLVELFTGSQCPPCVAADIAFDALDHTYKPAEAILLEYHLHIPGPDALTNPDSEARKDYYGKEFEGTPAIFFNGAVDKSGGGSFEDAQEKYGAYRQELEKWLEEPARAQLKAGAVRKGARVTINAEASEVARPGQRVRLRLALVESHVDYHGTNRIPSYHHVVRDMPGGPEGVALTEASGKQSATVDLDQLRARWQKYLDDFARESDVGFPNKERPLELKDLSVVAFVQDDANHEVLQAVRVPVREE